MVCQVVNWVSAILDVKTVVPERKLATMPVVIETYGITVE
jgi:hypothetical protein